MTKNWPLLTIISGGQSGADLAGLKAGKALGYPTGGCMPDGFLTEDGKHPEYADLYGVRELPYGNYSERTRVNVLESHGTLCFGDMTSPGMSLTIKLCRLYHRPHLMVGDESDGVTHIHWSDTDDARHWVTLYALGILNIAGNREGTHEGIGARVEAFLLEALKRP